MLFRSMHHPVPQLLDIAHERPILLTGEIEILVAAQEVTERFRRQQHLEGVERSTFVDVDQPALQHSAPLRQVVLCQDQLGAGAVQLRCQAANLPFDLTDDTLSRFALPLQVAQLVVDVVYLALQFALLLLELVPFGPDLLQSAAARLQSGVSLRMRRGAEREEEQDGETEGRKKRKRKKLPGR